MDSDYSNETLGAYVRWIEAGNGNNFQQTFASALIRLAPQWAEAQRREELKMVDFAKLMKPQKDEFDAAFNFREHLNRIGQTAPVDDDYPQVRFGYEQALRGLIEAMKANSRFIEGNCYGLKEEQNENLR